MTPELIAEIDRLVQDLSQGSYDLVVADGRGGRLTARELERAIHEYGRTVVAFPSEGLRLVDTFPRANDPTILALDVPLWTLEEGRSDLMLSLTAVVTPDGYRVTIDDIHVL